MPTRQTKPKPPKLSKKKLAQLDRAVDRIDEQMPAMTAWALAAKRETDTIRGIRRALKAARLHKGVSLADLDAKTGMGKANLSRLENSDQANPTIETLLRVADALGVEVKIAVLDREAGEMIDTGKAA